MRSNLGTKSRLAAHILALVLLILALIYVPPETGAPETIPVATETVAAATPVPEPTPVEPIVPVAETPVVVPEPVPVPEPAPELPIEPIIADVTPVAPVQEPEIAEETAETPEEISEPETPETVEEPVEEVVEETPEATEIVAPVQEPEPVATEQEPAQEPEAEAAPELESAPETETEAAPEPEAEEAAEPEAVGTESGEAGDAESVQPDESGSLVVASSETGVVEPVAVATPLKNANLEVLGDGVYWLSPRHDLETELAAIPELRSLIVLAPLPGHRVTGFEHVQTEVIPADPADLTEDAAERFIHLTDGANRPVVVAPLPGARGAAFFKGAYLLRNRALSEEDMLREIAPELDDAGTGRDDIIHRLARLAAEN